jgi:hypothetical protein
MDEGRLSARQHLSQAVRWRQLAAEATTARTRIHLLTLARDCELLATGGFLSIGTPPIVEAEREEAGAAGRFL